MSVLRLGSVVIKWFADEVFGHLSMIRNVSNWSQKFQVTWPLK